MQDNKIKIKAMCLLIHEGKIIVADGDSFKSSSRLVVPGLLFRVLGFSMNFNDTSDQAV